MARPRRRTAAAVTATAALVWGAVSVVSPGAAATTPLTMNLSCTFMGTTITLPLAFQITAPDSVKAGETITASMAVKETLPANLVQLMTGFGIASIDVKATSGIVYGGVGAGPATTGYEVKNLTPPASGDWVLEVTQNVQMGTTGAGTASMAMGSMTSDVTTRGADGQVSGLGQITGSCTPADPAQATILSVPVV